MARVPGALLAALREALAASAGDASSAGMFVRPTRRQISKANRLYDAGASREDIYNDLGLVRDFGRDSNLAAPNWMTELSDAEARFAPGLADFDPRWEARGRLGDLLDHPRLYDYDPEVADVMTSLNDVSANEFISNARNALTRRDLGDYHIRLDLNQAPRLGLDPIELPLHETQHMMDARRGGYLPSDGVAKAGISMARINKWVRKEEARLKDAANNAADAYWRADTNNPARQQLRAAMETTRDAYRAFRDMGGEAKIRLAQRELYKADPGEDTARRVQRRRNLTQSQIDSRAFPPWLDRDLPERDLHLAGPLTLGDYADILTQNDALLARLPAEERDRLASPAIRRLIEYLGYAAGAGGLGLSMGAVRRALEQELEREAA